MVAARGVGGDRRWRPARPAQGGVAHKGGAVPMARRRAFRRVAAHRALATPKGARHPGGAGARYVCAGRARRPGGSLLLARAHREEADERAAAAGPARQQRRQRRRRRQLLSPGAATASNRRGAWAALESPREERAADVARTPRVPPGFAHTCPPMRSSPLQRRPQESRRGRLRAAARERRAAARSRRRPAALPNPRGRSGRVPARRGARWTPDR